MYQLSCLDHIKLVYGMVLISENENEFGCNTNGNFHTIEVPICSFQFYFAAVGVNKHSIWLLKYHGIAKPLQIP